MSNFTRNLIERVLVSAAVAGLGVLTVALAEIDNVYVLAAIPVITAIKGVLSKFVGDPATPDLV